MLLGFAIAFGALITNSWGVKSSIFLLVGLLLFFSALFYHEDNFIDYLINTKIGKAYLFSAVLGGFITLIYIWIISIGTWTNWPETTNYYDLLAKAFNQGHLYLEENPDPALLALADPYNPDNREGIPVLWDLTLYKGKYFLYWGPVPALLLTLVKPLYSAPITDNILTFTFMVGLLFFQTLLILEVWKNYFQTIPIWAILLSISFTGLINPILYMLLEPRIYEAAVASGQFFFIGGLYFLFISFNKPSLAKFVLAGFFFTFAIGSRTTLLIPIGFLAIIMLVWAVKSFPAQAIKFIIAFALPLIIGGASYAWYNHARFDSFTEFGLGFQLTQTNIHETLGETFSVAYIPPNLFKLLLNPFESKETFPFIKATRWGGPAWYETYNPKIYDYYAEEITGILVGSPFLIFLIFAGIHKQKMINWITASLAVSSLLLFLTLLIFFYLTMRYLLDLLPALSLLACIGFWQGLQLFESRQSSRYFYTITSIALWAYTIFISFIICYSSNIHRIKIYNPELIQNITWASKHVFK